MSQFQQKDQLIQKFEYVMNSLNPRQREAVDAIEGPVMVIAGPGTGKTHILSTRIGNILLNTDTAPEQILCLTYTEAGTRAMRERLLELIGPTANKLPIYTFHAFCNKIIRDNPAYFGSFKLEPISDLEKIEIINKIIDELDIENPLLQGLRDPYGNVARLKNHFALMKSEGWTEGEVYQSIDKYLKELPTRDGFFYKRKYKEFQAGDPNPSKIKVETQRMEKLKAATRLYPRYLELMLYFDRYDYEDMILWVRNAFENDEDFLRLYQEQFLYFLVDEFQDTNGAQSDIVNHLIGYWEIPNIFIVGDDDQSIFEFQGARIENIKEFQKKHQDHLELIVLNENYRSSQEILDPCSHLIGYNLGRLVNEFGMTKELVASNPKRAGSHVKPLIKEFKSKHQELTDLVDHIRKLQDHGQELTEIAIIYARHAQSLELMTLLEAYNIPFNAKKPFNILKEPLIRNILTILKYFSDIQKKGFGYDADLFKMLNFPFVDINKLDLLKLSLHLSKQKSEERKSWRISIGDEEVLDKLNLRSKSELLDVHSVLTELQGFLNESSLAGFIEKACSSIGVLSYCLKHEDKVWQIQLLSTFYNFAKNASRKEPDMGIADLLALIDRMNSNNIELPITKSIRNKNGINLMTAHGAKGLEFEHVFMLNCTQANWIDNRGNASYKFSYPDTLTFTTSQGSYEGRRRLFFVAMSRAKTHLNISYSIGGQKDKKADFVDEINDNNYCDFIEPIIPEFKLLETHGILLAQTEAPIISQNISSLLEDRLDEFKLSPSALNSFLDCRLTFFYTYILKVPTVQTEYAMYGTAMHHGMNMIFKSMLKSEGKNFEGSEVLVQYFTQEMKRLRGNFQPVKYEHLLKLGTKNLTSYHSQNVSRWKTNVETEVFVDQSVYDGVPLKGTIDKIEFLENKKVNLVDYKTGTSKPANYKPLYNIEASGGRYWRQLVFYKILFEHSSRWHHEVVSAEVKYLDLDNKKDEFPEHQVIIGQEDIVNVGALIKEVYQEIRKENFYEGCGKPKCTWCTFVKTQKINAFEVMDEDMVLEER